MPEKMFPTGDSVDFKRSEGYTDAEIRRIGDLLERILHLLEKSPGCSNLDKGIMNGASSSDANESITPSEAAALLRISMPKMYELLRDKKVHSVKVGSKILVSRSSLMKMLQEV